MALLCKYCREFGRTRKLTGILFNLPSFFKCLHRFRVPYTSRAAKPARQWRETQTKDPACKLFSVSFVNCKTHPSADQSAEYEFEIL